jgi:peptide/nickel transport system substrate-binding protein
MKISLEKAGIELEVVSMDTKSRDAAFKSGAYELVIYGSGGLGNNADYLRTTFTKVGMSDKPAKNGGIPGYDNKKLDELAKEQLFEKDSEKRKTLIYQMQAVIADDVPAISLYNTAEYVCYNAEKYDGWHYIYNHHEMTHAKISYLDMDGFDEK